MPVEYYPSPTVESITQRIADGKIPFDPSVLRRWLVVLCSELVGGGGGGGGSFDPHSPGPIGDVTPSTVSATEYNLPNGGRLKTLTSYVELDEYPNGITLEIIGASGIRIGDYNTTLYPLTDAYIGLGKPGNRFAHLYVSGAARLGDGTNGPTLVADGNHILAQRNGTNPQAFNIYSSFTDASNYKRVRIGEQTFTGATGVGIWAEGIGTGAHVPLMLGASAPFGRIHFAPGGDRKWFFEYDGNLLTDSDLTYDIGPAAGVFTNRPRNIHIGGKITADSGGSSFQRTSITLLDLGTDAETSIGSLGSGMLRIIDSATGTTASSILFGNQTTAYPSLKRVAAALHVKLGDDSAPADLVFKIPTSNPGPGTLWNNAGVLSIGT